MKIFLMRHGQSEANKINMIQGHMNSKLSDLGKEQAKLAEILENLSRSCNQRKGLSMTGGVKI